MALSCCPNIPAAAGGGGPPVGSGAIWYTNTPPAGYLLCDGAAVDRVAFAALFAVLGTAFGVGNGSTTFNLPDLRRRVPVGLDATQSEFDALGKTGGATSVTLDVSMMPAHTHVQDAHTHVQNSHNHTQNSFAPRIINSGTAGTVGVQGASAASNANASNSATTATNQVATAVNQNATAVNQSTGGGAAHSNLQPYVVVNYVIKT